MAEADPDVELLTEIELVELDSLKKYANNPKNHTAEQIDTIKQSITEYGWVLS